MTLRTRLLMLLDTERTIDRMEALIEAQNRLIHDLQDESRRVRLEFLYEMQGMVAGWLIHHEQPEVDLREDLASLERTLGHQAARLEEHVL